MTRATPPLRSLCGCLSSTAGCCSGTPRSGGRVHDSGRCSGLSERLPGRLPGRGRRGRGHGQGGPGAAGHRVPSLCRRSEPFGARRMEDARWVASRRWVQGGGPDLHFAQYEASTTKAETTKIVNTRGQWNCRRSFSKREVPQALISAPGVPRGAGAARCGALCVPPSTKRAGCRVPDLQ